MSRFDHRLTRGLDEIAERVTPSSSALADLRARVAQQTPHEEVVIMMTPNSIQPRRPRRVVPSVVGATAAFGLALAGIILLRSDGDDVATTTDTKPSATTSVDTTAPTDAVVEDTAASPVDDSSVESADTTAPTEAMVEDEAVLELVTEDRDESAPAEGTWSLVASGDAEVGPGANDVVTGGPGFVAVGGGHFEPTVWTSADGVTWTRATDVPELDLDGVPRFGPLLSIGGGDPGFVALSGTGPFGGGESAVWTSPDGLSWAYVGAVESIFGDDDDVEVHDLIAGGPGFVAVGRDENRAAVWTSPDGVSWTRVPHDDAVFGDARMRAVIEAGPGLVAVGTLGFLGGEGAAAVWTSPDGLTWSRVAYDVAVFDDAAMAAVTEAGPGLVAVGADGWLRLPPEPEPTAAVWTSPDGLTWTRLPGDAFDGQRTAPLWTVVDADGHLVAIDEEDTPWYSTDGTTWTVIPHAEGEPPGEREIFSATGNGTRVVGVGEVGCHPCRAAVWNFIVPD